ncbi:MAG: Bacteriophage-type DNA polymerase [candidate division Zixibacteria bacterium RBG-1]|nr:MAG: Bacteriophage-type DNA polymerase [candidate division Zixibacteria bacterium RBG-1]OGC83773.1 MAG: hypothetical protein A2V73_02230 [candidate division Zixibacteria bacterium RBG_19FT_COMBO_42_43]
MTKKSDLIYLVTNYLEQQAELGLNELYMSKKTVKKSAVSSNGNWQDSKTLAELNSKIHGCTKCRLAKGRTKFVFGVGNPKAKLMFIGEAPGRDEDLQGEPFVGRAGQLLDKILAAINFKREEVYIANMVKCRPPENRAPETDEMDTCHPYLLKQIELLKPRIICCLGRISGQYLLQTKEALGKLRGKIHDYNGIKLMVTYHPAALLRYPEYKKETWEDMKLLRKEYEKLSA